MVTFQKRSASSDATNDDDEDEDEMITRLERDKEERRNRRKRAKLEVSDSEAKAKPAEENEAGKECSVCLIETKSASPEAETAAAAGEYPKSPNEEDLDAKNEPKEETEKSSPSVFSSVFDESSADVSSGFGATVD